MSKLKSLKVNSVLSENSYFKVLSINKDNVTVIDTNGIKSNISNGYVEQVLDSADYFTKEEKKTKTELAEILLNNPRIAMTVSFYKQDTPKTKKAYDAEKSAKAQEIASAQFGKIQGLIENLIDNPILTYIPGELRVMKGRHYGTTDNNGRLSFVDMDIVGDESKQMRLVDPRNIVEVIVNNTKYSLK